MGKIGVRIAFGLASLVALAIWSVGEVSLRVVVPMLILATLGWLFSFVQRDEP